MEGEYEETTELDAQGKSREIMEINNCTFFKCLCARQVSCHRDSGDICSAC